MGCCFSGDYPVGNNKRWLSSGFPPTKITALIQVHSVDILVVHSVYVFLRHKTRAAFDIPSKAFSGILQLCPSDGSFQMTYVELLFPALELLLIFFYRDIYEIIFMIIDFCIKITTGRYSMVELLSVALPSSTFYSSSSGHKFSRLSNKKIAFSRDASERSFFAFSF